MDTTKENLRTLSSATKAAKVPHDWQEAQLGHGETMCVRCFITNREAAVLGLLNECPTPPSEPSNG